MNFETVPSCKHEWTKSLRPHPVPAVFVREPYKKTFYIECLRCGFEKETCIKLDPPDECDHNWLENTELGPRYRAELCIKCFKSKYIKLE